MDESRYIAKYRSLKDLKNEALLLRNALELGERQQFPIVEFLELLLPQIEPEFVFRVKEIEEMPDKYGETLLTKNMICIRSDVYDGAIQNNKNDLITLCHELCHYLKHGVEEISLARTAFAKNLPRNYCPEWQADTFAELLLNYQESKVIDIQTKMKRS